MTDTFVIYTRPQAEAIALVHLTRQGFAAFLPLGQAPGEPAKALFPRYLFVEIARDENWAPILSTRGVSTLLSDDRGSPVPVPQGVMDDLRSRLAPGTNTVEIAPTGRKRPFQLDDKVAIIDGPFKSFDAMFLALRGETASVVLNIAGRAAKVTLDVNTLVAK